MTGIKLTVATMPRASYLDTGEIVELEFATDGESVTLRFTPNDLERFASRAMQLVNHVRSQTLSTGDHLAIHASTVVAASADSAVGGGKVLLTLLGDNGIREHFALSPAEAEKLRPQLFRAAKSAKAQSARSRH